MADRSISDDLPLLSPLPYGGERRVAPQPRPPADLANLPPTTEASPGRRLSEPRRPRFDDEDEVVNARMADPFLPPPPPPTPAFDLPSAEEAARIGAAVTAEQLAALGQAISDLYRRVEEEVAQSRELAAQAQAWLSEARTIVLARPEHYPLAELRVQQARVLLRHAALSRGSGSEQRTLALWNVGWLVLFVLLFALDGALTTGLLNLNLAFRPAGVPAAWPPSLVWYFQPWLCVLAGGVGGALGALVVLEREVRRREFDPASALDYRLYAPKGAILGGLTYFVLLGGFITVAATTDVGTDAGDLVQRIRVAGSPLFILVAFIAGFSQTRILALLADIWSDVTRRRDDEVLPPEQPTDVATTPVPVATPPTPASPPLPDRTPDFPPPADGAVGEMPDAGPGAVGPAGMPDDSILGDDSRRQGGDSPPDAPDLPEGQQPG